MASTVTVELDTTAPAAVTASIAGGAGAVAARDTTVAVGSSSSDAAQVKIWGDVDAAANPNIQATEGASAWITLASPHAIRLSTGDGTKTINVRLRDDVLNQSAPVSDTVVLDTTIPVPTVSSGPTAPKVSEQAGARSTSFTWATDAAIGAYEIRVVPTTGADRASGTLIPTTNGSSNVSGGAVGAATPVTTTVDGRDLKLASGSDGTKIIKIFVQDAATGAWSTV